MLIMVKSRALKKRYILFAFKGPDMDEQSLKRALYAEALSFFGELGLSEVALKLVAYDMKTNRGIIRCERDYQGKVLGFMALLDSIGDADVHMKALKSSGTIRSLNVSPSPRTSYSRPSHQA